MVAVSYGGRSELQGELSLWTEEISEILEETSARKEREEPDAGEMPEEKEQSLTLNLSLLSAHSQSPAVTGRGQQCRHTAQNLSDSSLCEQNTTISEAAKRTDSELPSPGRLVKRERKSPPPFHIPDATIRPNSPLSAESPEKLRTSPSLTAAERPGNALGLSEESKGEIKTEKSVKLAYETFGASEFLAAKQPFEPQKQPIEPQKQGETASRRHKTPPKLPETVLKPLVPAPTSVPAHSAPSPEPTTALQAYRKPPETPKRPPPVVIPSTPTLPASQDPDPSPSQLPIALPKASCVPLAPVLNFPVGSEAVPEAPKLNLLKPVIVPSAPLLPVQPVSASIPHAPALLLSPGFPTAPSISSLTPTAPSLVLKPGAAPSLSIPGLNLPKSAVPQALKTAVSKLKPVRMEPVTPDKVKDTIWEKAQSPTLILSDLEMYFGRAASKFEQTAESEAIPTAISLLCDEKRTRAFDMAYSRVKKMGSDAFEEAILGLKSAAISDNLLETLRTVVPTLEERNAVADNPEEVEKLNLASQLLVKICGIPRFAVRLTVLKLQRTAQSTISDITSQCELTLKALAEVTNSANFSAFLACVLHIGNALNDGTPRANAAGFKLTCLPQILSTRDNSGKETLLSYLTRILISQNPSCLQFPADFPTLKSAAALSFEQLTAESQTLRQSIDSVSVELTRAKSAGDERFVLAVEAWLPGLVAETHRVGELVTTVREQCERTAKYLGEDSAKLQPEEIFSVVLGICESVQRSTAAATAKLKRR